MMAVSLSPCARRQIIAITETIGPTLPFSVEILAHGDRGSGGIMLWNALELVR
jgi:hypothetical protein